MTNYKLEDDPTIACVLRVVSADRYAQAKAKVGRTTARKLFADLMKPLNTDEYSRVTIALIAVLRNEFKLRHKHVPERILTPALLLYVLEQAVDREAVR
jgi:hypothetical protein